MRIESHCQSAKYARPRYPETREFLCQSSQSLVRESILTIRVLSVQDCALQVGLALRLEAARALLAMGRLDAADEGFNFLKDWTSEGEVTFAYGAGCVPTSVRQQALRGLAKVRDACTLLRVGLHTPASTHGPTFPYLQKDLGRPAHTAYECESTVLFSSMRVQYCAKYCTLLQRESTPGIVPNTVLFSSVRILPTPFALLLACSAGS